MSEKKLLGTRRTLASPPAGILSLDPTVALKQRQARRPPAVAGSNYRPVILLAENRESTRVALKNVLEATGYDVIVVDRASEALSMGATASVEYLAESRLFHLPFWRRHPNEQVAQEQRFSDPACHRRSKPLLDCRKGRVLMSPGACTERDGRAAHHLFRETLLR